MCWDEFRFEEEAQPWVKGKANPGGSTCPLQPGQVLERDQRMMLVYLGCLREGIGKVLEGQDGQVWSRNGDLEQPRCLCLAWCCSHGG